MSIANAPDPARQPMDGPWSADWEDPDDAERGDPAVIPYQPLPSPLPAAESPWSLREAPPDDRIRSGPNGRGGPSRADDERLFLMGLTYDSPLGLPCDFPEG